MTDLIIYNIGELVTSRELDRQENETSLENIEVLKNGYIAVKNGRIYEVGSGEFPESLRNSHTQVIDAEGKVITPGLVDSHTHLVHYGSRENELALKIKGVPYLDILKAGGGILSSVRATRAATTEQLIEKATATLNRMLSFGVTTVESKSGYGLNLETEIKQLEINKILNETHPVDVVSTFMAAHAIPEEFKGRGEEYVDEVIRMMPIVKELDLAEFCDVFCEDAVFTVENTRKILNKAKEYGFKLKIHADEIVSLGGGELAGELHCISADHLMAVSDEGIKALKKGGVIANILPGTSFNLGKAFAPVKKMLDEGVEVAISSDYNPGSCPCENLQLAMQIASSQIKLTPKEILKAVTINGAKAIGKEKVIGSLEKGKKADFVIFDTKNIDYIFYNFGINHVCEVYKNGESVFKVK